MNGYSETTPEGRKQTKLNQTLLNGNNICMASTIYEVFDYGLTICFFVAHPW